MGKPIRILIAITALLALLFLAGRQAAWAANPASQSNGAAPGQAGLSVAADKDDDDDCKQDKKDKDKNKNKDKDKKKDKCEDDDDDDGTVKPPHDENAVCKRGDYSVGGVASLQVKNLRGRGKNEECFKTKTEDASSVSGLPGNAGAVLADVVVLESLGPGSSVKICFAAPPGKKVKIYASRQDSWKALGTSVKNGQACAQVPRSGSFALAGR